MQKMALQIVVYRGICRSTWCGVADVPLTMLVPFSGGYYWDIGWLAIPVLFFAVIGTVNGTNFTDGLDGLASSVTSACCYIFHCCGDRNGEWNRTGYLCGSGSSAGDSFCLMCILPVCSWEIQDLWALGGFVAGTAYMLQMPLFIIIVGFIYLVEVASVIIQVTYFKKTGGKRIFKMAPIHHHFELCGWSETRVVAVFSVITALLCLIALMGGVIRWILNGKKVLVFGSGISGEAAAVLLNRKGAYVVLYDGNEKLDAEKIKEKMPENVRVVLGAFPEKLLDGLDLTVMSPGVPTESADSREDERERDSCLG